MLNNLIEFDINVCDLGGAVICGQRFHLFQDQPLDLVSSCSARGATCMTKKFGYELMTLLSFKYCCKKRFYHCYLIHASTNSIDFMFIGIFSEMGKIWID